MMRSITGISHRVGGGISRATFFLAFMMLGSSGALSAPHSVVPLALQFGPAPTPVAGGGRDHLIYELRVTNFSGRTITLAEVDVVDRASGRRLGQHVGKDLAGMTGTPGLNRQGEARLTIEPGGFCILYFDTIVRRGSAAGRTLMHSIRIVTDKPDAPKARVNVQAPPLDIARGEPLIVGAPLRGARWLAANALSNDADHRRTIAVVDGQARIAQRYAIDFVKLDAHGRAFLGDPSRNDSWAGYGASVLAVADGIVEAVKDGIVDNRPLAAPAVPITLDTVAGNYVVLRLNGGQRVLYGHLKPGSILVREGKRVTRGEVLGALGNSGQSDAPHLHIHVADAPSALGAEGLAFAFHRFLLEGYVPSLEVLESPTGWKRTGREPAVRSVDELPLANAVIGFEP